MMFICFVNKVMCKIKHKQEYIVLKNVLKKLNFLFLREKDTKSFPSSEFGFPYS